MTTQVISWPPVCTIDTMGAQTFKHTVLETKNVISGPRPVVESFQTLKCLKLMFRKDGSLLPGSQAQPCTDDNLSDQCIFLSEKTFSLLEYRITQNARILESSQKPHTGQNPEEHKTPPLHDYEDSDVSKYVHASDSP